MLPIYDFIYIFFDFQSNLIFAERSSLELGKDGGNAVAGGGAPVLAETHAPRMEAAPNTHMDDGFGGSIPDVGDFGRKFVIGANAGVQLSELKPKFSTFRLVILNSYSVIPSS